jgi:calcineurin-like phosphoesterase family protein
VARRLVPLLAVALIGAAQLLAPHLYSDRPYRTPGPLPTFPAGATVLLAVGDVGTCDDTNDDLVARLAKELPGSIALLGDIVYPDGGLGDYRKCFDPSWGPLRPRIHPAQGNHDFESANVSGYYDYFGAAAGTPHEGWYSYDLGTWHVVVLNSDCASVGGCGAGSPQLAWLQADLQTHPATCTLAYWHHPRYSSGEHGDNPATEALWQALAAAGADLVLSGHDHDYERLAPVDGIRSFVVGTGGHSLIPFKRPSIPQTELRSDDSYGLLALDLRPAGFTWQFVPIPGDELMDHGSAACH